MKWIVLSALAIAAVFAIESGSSSSSSSSSSEEAPDHRKPNGIKIPMTKHPFPLPPNFPQPPPDNGKPNGIRIPMTKHPFPQIPNFPPNIPHPNFPPGPWFQPNLPHNYDKEPRFPMNVLLCAMAHTMPTPPRPPAYCNKPSKSLNGTTPHDYADCGLRYLLRQGPGQNCEAHMDPRAADPGFPLSNYYCLMARLAHGPLGESPFYCRF